MWIYLTTMCLFNREDGVFTLWVYLVDSKYMLSIFNHKVSSMNTTNFLYNIFKISFFSSVELSINMVAYSYILTCTCSLGRVIKQKPMFQLDCSRSCSLKLDFTDLTQLRLGWGYDLYYCIANFLLLLLTFFLSQQILLRF